MAINSSILESPIHFYNDCQAASLTASNNNILQNKIEIILKIEARISQLSGQDYHIYVHWVPGHMGIKVNELADKQDKDGALEVRAQGCNIPAILHKKEAVTEIKNCMKEKWR